MAVAAQSESLLMPYEEYMERCTETYGQDRTTASVCEAQYQAIEKKEQALMAQVEEQDDTSRSLQWQDDQSLKTE